MYKKQNSNNLRDWEKRRNRHILHRWKGNVDNAIMSILYYLSKCTNIYEALHHYNLCKNIYSVEEYIYEGTWEL